MTAAILGTPVSEAKRGPVLVPPVPSWVAVEMFEVGTTAHGHIDGAAKLPCGLKAWPFWLLPLVQAQRVLRPVFCLVCWPGKRCQICGLPSGESAQCARCLHVSLTLDKRYARAEH